MYIIINAFKNLRRNKGRNILLGMIMFVLISAVTVALIINSTTKEIIDDYQNRFGSKVTLSVDFDKMMSDMNPNEDGTFGFPEAPQISSTQYMEFADSKYLKNYKMDMVTGVAFSSLKAVDESDNDSLVGSINDGNINKDYMKPTAKLMGFSDSKNLPDFEKGLRKIIDGELYKGNDECLISSDFADLNKLKVGDTFEIIDPTSKKLIQLKVSGIYADATKDTDVPSGSMSLEGSYGNRRNELLVSMDTMVKNFSMDNLVISAEYELVSPESVEGFEKELHDKGLPDVYNVETDEASYNKIVAPVIGLSQVSMTFMWVILVIGCIVLLFVTSMAVRERKYEIGVLRAMGMKKAKVAFMLVTECMVITMVCLTIGLGVGTISSQPIADVLIDNQIEVKKNTGNNDIQYGNGSIGMEESPKVDPLDKIDVSLTSNAAIQIVMIALSLALLSSLVGVVFITKYEPMKILSERN